jgi:hypothetical protein
LAAVGILTVFSVAVALIAKISFVIQNWYDDDVHTVLGWRLVSRRRYKYLIRCEELVADPFKIELMGVPIGVIWAATRTYPDFGKRVDEEMKNKKVWNYECKARS